MGQEWRFVEGDRTASDAAPLPGRLVALVVSEAAVASIAKAAAKSSNRAFRSRSAHVSPNVEILP